MAIKPDMTNPACWLLLCHIFVVTASPLGKTRCNGTFDDGFALLTKWGNGYGGDACFLDVDLTQTPSVYWNCDEGDRVWYRETENNYIHHYAGDRVYTMIDGVAYYMKQPAGCIETELMQVEITSDRDIESALISMVPEEGADPTVPSRLEVMCDSKFSQVIASTSDELECDNDDEPTQSDTYSAYWLGYPGCSTYEYGCGYPRGRPAGYGCDNILQHVIHQCHGNSLVELNGNYVNAFLAVLLLFCAITLYSMGRKLYRNYGRITESKYKIVENELETETDDL